MKSRWFRVVVASVFTLVLTAGAPAAFAQDKDAKNKNKTTKTPKTDSKTTKPTDKKASDKTEETKTRATGSAEFEIYKDKGNKFRFRLKDAEGNILCGKMGSKGFDTKEQCMKAVEQIRRDAVSAKIDDQTK